MLPLAVVDDLWLQYCRCADYAEYHRKRRWWDGDLVLRAPPPRCGFSDTGRPSDCK